MLPVLTVLVLFSTFNANAGVAIVVPNANEAVDIVTVKELMGHKDINMTMRYSHPTPEHKKQAVNRLNFNNLNCREIQLKSVEKLANTD